MSEVNVLIGSGGRRNCLVNWFRDAIADRGVQGNVCVIDASDVAPALADADRSAVVPPFGSEEYLPAVGALCKRWDISLAFSLNDFESTLWATAQPSPFAGDAIDLIAASTTCQALVEDKVAYSGAFASGILRTPETLLASHACELSDLPWGDSDVVVKHRYGSGSVGLARVPAGRWREQVATTAVSAKDKFGIAVKTLEEGMENVVVQRAIDGVEYGLDVVHDFDGTYAAALARRKLRMRSGETDQAVTVASAPFEQVAHALGEITRHRGLIDTDLIVDSSGTHYVIDVNPRFGGGYPFSHVAGARIPDAYINWHLGRAVPRELLTYTAGVASAKTEDIRVARQQSVVFGASDQ